MKIAMTIQYTSGEPVTYVAGLPEWAKWERKFNKSMFDMPEDIKKWQQSDFLALAHFAYVRAAAGKPTLNYETWENTVDEISIGEIDTPKAVPAAVSSGGSGG